MKAINFVYAATTALLAACSQTDETQSSGETYTISFQTTAETRAAVGADKVGMQDFLVWGGYTDPLLFDGETVHSDGTYDGGTRYWVPGKAFSFYAIHPATLSGVSFSSDTFTVNGFDASKTGSEAVDLMTASVTGLTEPQTVRLGFEHELARVNVNVVSEGDAVTISNIKLYGISHKGNFNSNVWTLDAASDASVPSFTNANLYIPADDTQARPLFGGDLLLPPHMTLDGATLELDYHYATNDAEKKHGSVALKTETVTKWTKGQHYNYHVKIQRNSTDVSLSVTVEDWETKDYTVSW